MKQQCPVAFVILDWLVYAAGIAYFALTRLWWMLPVWIVIAPLGMWAYIRWFPAIAPFMGYGRLEDRPASPTASAADVTLYTALGCPFCPIVKRRLADLQPKMGFHLREIDVTTRPDILTRKGIWSVPVIEVGERRVVGHATSEQLANLIAGRPVEIARPIALPVAHTS